VGCAKKNTPPFTTTVLPLVVPEVPVANTPSYLMAIDSIHNQPWKWYYAKIDVNYNDFDKHFCLFLEHLGKCYINYYYEKSKFFMYKPLIIL
jgi:hypothetical protein